MAQGRGRLWSAGHSTNSPSVDAQLGIRDEAVAEGIERTNSRPPTSVLPRRRDGTSQNFDASGPLFGQSPLSPPDSPDPRRSVKGSDTVAKTQVTRFRTKLRWNWPRFGRSPKLDRIRGTPGFGNTCLQIGRARRTHICQLRSNWAQVRPILRRLRHMAARCWPPRPKFCKIWRGRP